MTAREAAKDLIRFYVHRGDDPEWTRNSWMGSYSKRYCASISGRVNGKSYDTHHIVVSELAGQPCCGVFSFEELWKEIEGEKATGLCQARLL